jgi:hypothetical protein
VLLQNPVEAKGASVVDRKGARHGQVILPDSLGSDALIVFHHVNHFAFVFCVCLMIASKLGCALMRDEASLEKNNSGSQQDNNVSGL